MTAWLSRSRVEMRSWYRWNWLNRTWRNIIIINIIIFNIIITRYRRNWLNSGRIHTIFFLWILIKTGFFYDSLTDFHLLPELDCPRLGGHLVLSQLHQLVLLLEAQRLLLPQLRLRQHLLVLHQRI